MGRIYDVTMTATSFSAADRDLVQVTSQSTKVTKLLSCKVTQSNRYGDANAAGQVIQIVRAATTGSGGGTTLTARPKSPGDSAFGGSITAGFTTAAATPTVLVEEGTNLQAGFHWTPTEKCEIEIAPSGIIAIRYTGTPAAATTFTVQLELEELG